LVHIGVDGGAFPLFAPVDPVSLGLPYWGQAAFVAASVVFLVLAAGSIRALLMPRYGLAALAVVVGIVLLLVFVVPPNAGFNSV
jgi:hypothetical protein